MIRAVSHISVMSPYALAQLNPPVGKRLISLSQNESIRPPSPHSVTAACKALAAGHLYPDPDWGDLRAALSELHSLPMDGILCGNGSMELIACITQAFADENNAVLAPAHAYPFFRTAAGLARARFDIAPEQDGYVSVDALLEAVRHDTRMLFLANPGNPTGTRISRTELLRLRDALRGDILLVIDEAYGEFADHLNEPMFDLVKRGNTVVLRTFSKAYGLAGMRVGWGVFPTDIAVEIRKVLSPNNISLAGQAAATAALADQPYMHETSALTAGLRDGFSNQLRRAGFDLPESFTNFVLIRLRNAKEAQRADEALREEGVFLRPQGGAGLTDCLRVTIGVADDLDFAAGLLERWIKKERL
ncbi:MAG: histidinol-phosphate transaminase [Ruegeria sp.]